MQPITKKDFILKLRKIAERGWIPNARHGNVGGVGNTLEDLLGIEENNLPIPNAAEWELKTQRSNSASLITLFHSEPSPRALKFVPAILLPKYGWTHQGAGTKYPKGEMSFRQTINAMSRSDRGFGVQIDRKNKKILISFDAKAVSSRHADWLKSVQKRIGLRELDPQPYWGFSDLQPKVATKLHNCFFVLAERKKDNGKEMFRYSKALKLQGFDFEGFIHGLETGNILVDFDARTGHNHGTKFRMRRNYWPNLYKKHDVLFDLGPEKA